MEIVCTEFISGKQRSFWANVVHPDGRQECLSNLDLRPSKVWQSKKTKEKYPLEWEIEIYGKNGQKINLKTRALIKDQEIKAGMAKYWEGPIEINGLYNGQKVRGSGFMELVNHASPYGLYSVSEFEKSVRGFFK